MILSIRPGKNSSSPLHPTQKEQIVRLEQFQSKLLLINRDSKKQYVDIKSNFSLEESMGRYIKVEIHFLKMLPPYFL